MKYVIHCACAREWALVFFFFELTMTSWRWLQQSLFRFDFCMMIFVVGQCEWERQCENTWAKEKICIVYKKNRRIYWLWHCAHQTKYRAILLPPSFSLQSCVQNNFGSFSLWCGDTTPSNWIFAFSFAGHMVCVCVFAFEKFYHCNFIAKTIVRSTMYTNLGVENVWNKFHESERVCETTVKG